MKYMGIYTMSCETGSDIKHKAFVKVISKFSLEDKLKTRRTVKYAVNIDSIR